MELDCGIAVMDSDFNLVSHFHRGGRILDLDKSMFRI
jgi:hypothetical protein